MLEIAKKVKPYSINIVPEKREELATEGGLDIINMYNKLSSIIMGIITAIWYIHLGWSI